jgi:hypothetical protein
MRVIYAGLLLTGMILIGASVYETTTTTTDQAYTTSAMEDGTPMPSPNGPSKPVR